MENTTAITLVRVKNPFNLRDRDILTMDYCGRTISELKASHCPGIDIIVSVNGRIVPDPLHAITVPGRTDCVVFAPRIHGDDTGKTILRAVSMLALMGFAAWAMPAYLGLASGTLGWTVGMTATAMAGGYLVSALLPSPASESSSDTQIYDWSPSTVQQQGLVVPKIYGRNKLYGNVISSYISRDGDKNYLNVLLSLGLGPVKALTDFKIGGQDYANYKGVEITPRYGYLTEAVIEAFNDTKVEFSVGVNISGGSYYIYTTENDNFDALEVEVAFPTGLWQTDGDGNYLSYEVSLTVEYMVDGGATWIIMPSSQSSESYTTADYGSGRWSLGRYYTDFSSEEATIWHESQAGDTNYLSHIEGETSGAYYWRWIMDIENVTYAVANYFKVSGSSAKTIYKTFRVDNLTKGNKYKIKVTKNTSDPADTDSYGYEMCLNMVREASYDDYIYPRNVLVGIKGLADDQLSGSFDFCCLSEGALILAYMGNSWWLRASSNPAWVCWDILTQPVIADTYIHNGNFETWTDSTTITQWAALNDATYQTTLAQETVNFTDGKYAVKITNGAGKEAILRTGWHSTDAPVDNTIVPADWSGKTFTFGCWIKAYTANRAQLTVRDTDGTGWQANSSSYHSGAGAWEFMTVTRQFRSNLTGVVIDIRIASGASIDVYADEAFVQKASSITYIERYDGIDPARLDLTKFKEWADWCDETLTSYGTPRCTFNGGFDSETTMWEAAVKVAEMGRAALVWNGVNLTVAIDKVGSPVQLFTVGNIINDQFVETFLPLDDRAAEMEIDFLNKDSDYGREKISVFNSSLSTKSNKVGVDAFGLTDPKEAWRYGMLKLYQNQYLLGTIEFEADIDAIACTVGDVINIQHDIPQWGWGGRLVACVNGEDLTLDRNDVVLSPDKTWTLLVRLSDDTIEERTITATSILGNPGFEAYSGNTLLSWSSALNGGFVNGETVNVKEGVFAIAISAGNPYCYIFQSLSSPQSYINSTLTLGCWVKASIASKTRIIIQDSAGYSHAYHSGDGNWEWLTVTHTIALGSTSISAQLSVDNGGGTAYFDKCVLKIGTSVSEADFYSSQIKAATPFTGTPKKYDVYALGEVNKAVKPFRVLGIEKASDQKAKLSCIEYSSSIYNIDTLTPALPTVNYSSLDPWPPVTDLKLAELLIKSNDGTLLDVIEVYFARPVSSEYASADIYYSNGDSWTYAGNTTGESFRINGVVANRTYKVAVVTINTSGVAALIQTSPQASITTLGKLAAPSDVTGFTTVAAEGFIKLSWTHIPDADLWGYEIRLGGSDWNSATVVVTGVATDNYYYQPGQTGNLLFRIKAIDTSNIYSTHEAQYSFTFSPCAVSSLTSAVIDNYATLSWAGKQGTFPIDYYEIRKGADYTTATVLGTVTGTFTTLFETASGTYTYWVVGIDTTGYYGADGKKSISAIISQPPDFILKQAWNSDFTSGPVSHEFTEFSSNFKSGGDGAKTNGFFALNTGNAAYIAAGLVTGIGGSRDSTLYMLCDQNTDAIGSVFTAPFIYRELSGDFDVETYLSNIPDLDINYECGMFIIRDPNASAGEDHVWIGLGYYNGINDLRWVNTVNSSSTEYNSASTNHHYSRIVRSGSTVTAYSKANANDSWTQRGQFTRSDFKNTVQVGLGLKTGNALESLAAYWEYFRINSGIVRDTDGGYLVMADPTETFQQHFTNNFKNTFADFTGADILIQPSKTAAEHTEVFDYGAVISNSQVTVVLTSTALKGSTTVNAYISTSADKVTWSSEYNGTETYATSFRYVKVRLAFSGSGGDDVLRLSNLECKLSLKKKKEFGNDTVSTASTGKAVDITGFFTDVDSIQITAKSTGAARYAVYDFTDAPNPTSFTVYLFDSTGAKVTGDFSWSVEGY
ncbi:MAG: phage tail protein [Deltaproteobacteria bacterium]